MTRKRRRWQDPSQFDVEAASVADIRAHIDMLTQEAKRQAQRRAEAEDVLRISCPPPVAFTLHLCNGCSCGRAIN